VFASSVAIWAQALIVFEAIGAVAIQIMAPKKGRASKASSSKIQLPCSAAASKLDDADDDAETTKTSTRVLKRQTTAEQTNRAFKSNFKGFTDQQTHEILVDGQTLFFMDWASTST
jgi:gas vesicle protein